MFMVQVGKHFFHYKRISRVFPLKWGLCASHNWAPRHKRKIFLTMITKTNFKRNVNFSWKSSLMDNRLGYYQILETVKFSHLIFYKIFKKQTCVPFLSFAYITEKNHYDEFLLSFYFSWWCQREFICFLVEENRQDNLMVSSFFVFGIIFLKENGSYFLEVIFWVEI